MKLSTVATLLCLVPAASSFVVAPPTARAAAAPRSSQQQCTTMLSGLPEAAVSIIHSSVVPLLAAGSVAEPGTVDAPAWVLPAGAAAVILTAGLIPLLLKVCVGSSVVCSVHTLALLLHYSYCYHTAVLLSYE